MHISIIIVNYNVKYFLEQCLKSVEKSVCNVSFQVIVVDNNSTDDSINYLKPKFPNVHFICNTDNVGFGKANNQALSYCKGEYILYLNPDTIIPEDCLQKCVDFFEHHGDCGALGVKMIDGSGRFLPESKRGFPSPVASFFKLTGIADIFPTSPFFNQYSLGYLSPFENHKVEVLAGAFLMARSEIIHQIGGFDEAFFMYGEDIDLSYRIQKQGFNNYYFSDTTILHFKGESTKKGSLNYVKMFYVAMSIFVKKHYAGSSAKAFELMIQLAIFCRAIIALLKSGIVKLSLPIVDAIIIFFSFLWIKDFWIEVMRSGVPFTLNHFPLTFLSFTIIFLIAGALSGMYDMLDKPYKAFLASVSGIVFLVTIYGLLPERFWFSRAVVILGGLAAGLSISLFRWILLKCNLIESSSEEFRFQQTAVVGSTNAYQSVASIYKKAGLEERLLGRIDVGDEELDSIGSIRDIQQLVSKLNIKELIFCEGKLSYYLIMQIIQTLPHQISYRFIGENTDSIVGSDSKATTGETLGGEGYYKINEAYQKRMKRIFDLAFSIFILVTLPFQLIFVKNIFTLIDNTFKVLMNKATWVGYTFAEPALPIIKKNIITCFGLPIAVKHPLNKEALHHLNIQYAKNYDLWLDGKIIFKNYKQIGS